MTTTNESSTDNRFYRETTTRPADGGPAFPSGLTAKEVKFANGRVEGAYVSEFASSATGLSLRDYFAAKVLQGLMANEQFPPPRPIEQARTREEMADEIAGAAYRMADAMLKARG
ncbi:hypothetical protein [Burkholderia glumae]|uniref:hypothetical protein n=1 Tax=Burkholderia glumae TaxID=337 RepID=UPI0002E5542D|nr:hypothetical protein [Burkholderia glumae]PJO24880.1 hypothetical protein Y5A_000255 [Burkholderia glumae AU6208]QHE11843.1 hypothetical protein GQR88_16485 [Burkholderia glumae AU6208]